MGEVFFVQGLWVSHRCGQGRLPRPGTVHLGPGERVDLLDRAIPHGLDGFYAGKKCITHALQRSYFWALFGDRTAAGYHARPTDADCKHYAQNQSRYATGMVQGTRIATQDQGLHIGEGQAAQ